MEAPAEGDYKAARAILEAEAKAQVSEQIKVWTVVKALDDSSEDIDFSVADSEIDSFTYTQWLYMYLYYQVNISQDQILAGYGKENIRTALAFDKLMNYLTETQAEVKDENGNVTTEADGGKYLNIGLTRQPKTADGEGATE